MSAQRPLPQRLEHHPAVRVLLSALAGTLLFLACADFDIWPLAWLGLFPLLFVLLDAGGHPRTRRPFLYGWICGLFANGGGFYWIIGLLMRFGHMPFVAALPIFLLLVAYQALTFGLFASILCRLRAQIGVPVTWLAPITWVACELCVPYVFPWYLAITQAWVPPVIQVADLTGPLGVSFLLVLSNAAIFDVYAAWRRAGRRERRTLPFSAVRAPVFAAGIIALSLVYGQVRIRLVEERRAAADHVKVGVVQANIGIQEKFVPGLRAEQNAVHQQLSAALERQGAELIVWPESSYPYALGRPVAADFPSHDPRMVRRGFSTPLLFGALTVDESGAVPVPYNTALMMDRDGRVTGSFDKNFLLVFGEYIPYAEHMGWLREMVPEMSNFARGTTTATFPLDLHGRRYWLGPMICYEDIIPAFARRLVGTAGPHAPNLLINITNDAWFGATSEPWEHMALAVFRAVEHREDLVRAVNTGVSALIDATGRVRAKTRPVDPLVTPGVPPMVLLGDAALLPPGGLYQRLGDTFGGACLALVLALGALGRLRAGRPVRWRWIGAGFASLAAVVGGLALVSQAGGAAVLGVLVHHDEHALSESQVFTATWQVALALAAASAALGALLRVRALRASRGGGKGYVPGRLEALAAVICVTVAPVVFCGRMEGNTGAVVVLTLLCAGAALEAGWLAGKFTTSAKRAAAPAPR